MGLTVPKLSLKLIQQQQLKRTQSGAAVEADVIGEFPRALLSMMSPVKGPISLLIALSLTDKTASIVLLFLQLYLAHFGSQP